MIYSTFSATPKCISTVVLWKDRANLSDAGSTSKQDNPSKTAKKRPFEQNKSFFEWLNNTTDPYTDDIAEVIKDDLWLNPLQYYLVPDAEPEEQQTTATDELSSSDDGEHATTSRTDESREFSTRKYSVGFC